MIAILYMEAVIMFTLTLNKILNNKIICILTLGLVVVSQSSLGQTTTENTMNSYSIAGLKSTMVEGEISHSHLLEQGKDSPSNRNQKLRGMNREQVLTLRKTQVKQLPDVKNLDSSTTVTSNYHHTFSIYTGFAQLIEDIDYDGYFQTFSVTFDADLLSPIYGEEAVVYADLYLSQNGGPWMLYFSTDDFVITGQETDDEFEVVTQLDSGYVTDHYDVLIDLYEVGFSDVVATYSSNDSNELYALPLESSDYDPEYVEVIEYSEHSGGISWLLGLLVMLTMRRSLVKSEQNTL